jgi:ubiquinone biosynthesis protein
MRFLFSTARRLRHTQRIAAIAEVAVKHGFGYFVDRLGLARLVRRARPGAAATGLSAASRIVMGLQELGPTFVKAGQAISTRADLIPPEFVRELGRLQDEVPPVPYEMAAKVVEQELGAPPEIIFRSFDPVPVAAASMGQVHHAVTRDGREVVVKVQRPGIERIIQTDLEILTDLAALVEERIPSSRRYQPSALVREFAEVIADELMFNVEGHNCDRMRQNLRGQPIKVPEVLWELTTRRVLTLERVHGYKITDRKHIEQFDLRSIATSLAQSMIRQILVDGFFHGDPHPGNLFISAEGQLVLMDFGIVGRLDARSRGQLMDLFIALFRQDADAVVTALSAIGVMTDETDQQALSRDISRLLSKYYFLPRSELRVGELLTRMMTLIYRHQVRVPAEFAMIAKALFTAEGVCLMLVPDFDFNQAVRPLTRMLRDYSAPLRRATADIATTARELSRIAPGVPRGLGRILEKAERGQLRLRVEYDEGERTMKALLTAFNRLSVSILTAGILVTAATVSGMRIPPYIFGYSAWGLVGLAFGAVLAIWFLLQIRHPRSP